MKKSRLHVKSGFSKILSAIANVFLEIYHEENKTRFHRGVPQRLMSFESLESRQLLSVSPLFLPNTPCYNENPTVEYRSYQNTSIDDSPSNSIQSGIPPMNCFTIYEGPGGSGNYLARCGSEADDGAILTVTQKSDASAIVSTFSCMANTFIHSGEGYWDKTSTNRRADVWTWAIPEGISNEEAVRNFTFTGETCCGPVTFDVYIDMIPEFVSDIDADLVDPLPKNIDSYSHYLLPDAEAGDRTEGRQVDSEHLRPVAYSIDSQKDQYGNNTDLFSIDSSSGEITLTRDMTVAEKEMGYNLAVRVSELENPLRSDTASVSVGVVKLDFNPYTPETVHIAPMVIPKENWQENNVGIRRNGDFDDGNSSADWFSGTASAAENDLIRLDIDITFVSGIQYYLRATDASPEVRLWRSSQKGGYPLSFAGDGFIVSNDMTVFAEYISAGSEYVTFELVAVHLNTGEEVYSEEIVFRPFESVTCVFVGENQTPGNASASPGLNEWVVQELLNGYDVHVWDDGHDWFSWDDCDEWGRGPALDEIANGCNRRSSMAKPARLPVLTQILHRINACFLFVYNIFDNVPNRH